MDFAKVKTLGLNSPYKNLCVVFVNEILESEKLKEVIITRNERILARTTNLGENQFEKYNNK